MIHLIAAMDLNRNIGLNGNMPWGHSQKSDLLRFKNLTQGKIVVMGRKTYESIGAPLCDRLNIVLTSDASKLIVPEGLSIGEGIVTGMTMDQILETDKLRSQSEFLDIRETLIIGGAQIYEQFMPYADKIYLTKIHAYLEGDTKFPSITGTWDIHSEGIFPSDENNLYPYEFLTYTKRS
ncbi:dihydrofolate reductase [Bacillus stercoris]|nr:dihydrofolate reductase [Bacillus stercoris]